MKKILYFFGLTVIACITQSSGCKKDDEPKLGGACEAGTEDVANVNGLDNDPDWEVFTYPFTPNHVYYIYPGNGKVIFTVGINQGNLCTKAHLDVTYTVLLNTSLQPEPLRIFAEGYW